MDTLTPQTLAILKNFASINKNLFAEKGKTLSTISEVKNILAFATIDEELPQEFGVYDLNEFLGAVGLLEDPTLEWGDTELKIKSGRSRVNYRFADKTILTFPSKKINMPEADITVNIEGETLSQVRKAAAALGHTIMALRSEDGAIVLSVVDPKNSGASTYSISVGDCDEDADFDLQFLIANLKVLPGDYKVEISSKKISKWDHETEPVEYFIALEKTSTYN